jgi:hypothetical protein
MKDHRKGGAVLPPTIILLEGDLTRKTSLELLLRKTSGQLYKAGSLADLRQEIARKQARVAVLDMEVVSLPEVKQLSREFPATSLVCHHPLADDDMWTAAMNAGASDLCSSDDGKSILRAVEETTSCLKRGAAA